MGISDEIDDATIAISIDETTTVGIKRRFDLEDLQKSSFNIQIWFVKRQKKF